jgi:hypothetical protein
MVFIAALIAIEKLLPWKRWASLGSAVVLVALAVAVAVAPSQVPGLTIPDSPAAGHAMRAMGMPAPDAGMSGHMRAQP